MIGRRLYEVAFDAEWGRQMRFVVGPRQAGKTTLAKLKLREEGCEQLYYLWDLRRVRERAKDHELFFTEDGVDPSRKLWVCFAEIHKTPKWKNILKGAFDETGDRYQFIVTGSAKLDIKKRAGDSLAGRYFVFRLLPLVLTEAAGRTERERTPETAEDFLERRMAGAPADQQALRTLLEYGGFPEPFQRQSRAFHRKWIRDYLDTVIREDIGSLTRIVDREYLFDLCSLLPQAVGSPLSQASLASHLQISPITVRNYLRRLEDFYLVFSVRPYAKNIKRSLLKARKYYLYDWSRIENAAARFENYVACELTANLALWRDSSGFEWDLHYVRNKQKQETDFLVTREGRPWLLVETKLADGTVARHHHVARSALGNIPFVQVCLEPDVLSVQKRDVYRMSAGRLFG